MNGKCRPGDRVSWNSASGRVSGRVIKVHTKDSGYKGTRITPAKSGAAN